MSENVKRHKHADLIIAWANDTTIPIQFRIDPKSKWKDYLNNDPAWAIDVEYRIKPQKKMYRVGLFAGGVHAVSTDEFIDEATMHSWIDEWEKNPNFVRWLTPWVEYDPNAPKEWPSELVSRVAKVNREAAKWLRDNWNDLNNHHRTTANNKLEEIESIDSLLTWDRTPQGYNFWLEIYNKL